MELSKLIKPAFFTSALLCTSLASSIPSNAQLTIQLGGDEGQLRAMLQSRGYDRIETVKLSLTHSRFNACKGTVRYHLDVKWNGRIDSKKTGDCRSLVNVDSVSKMLAERGYERINIESSQGKYTAVGCARGNRIRIDVNRVGEIVNESRIGNCSTLLTSTDLINLLKKQNYDRIEFTDLNPPRYGATACQNGNRYNLAIDPRGQIRGRDAIGKCRTRISPKDIAGILEKNEFTQIKVTDSKLPEYKALACQENIKFEVVMNRFGQITDEIYHGVCEQPYNASEIKDAMIDQGYTNISVSQDKDKNFSATGCIQGRLTDVRLTQYGKFITRKDRGSCKTIRVNELADILRKRGMKNLEFSVVGCRKGRLERITFDEYANRVDTEKLGRCN